MPSLDAWKKEIARGCCKNIRKKMKTRFQNLIFKQSIAIDGELPSFLDFFFLLNT